MRTLYLNTDLTLAASFDLRPLTAILEARGLCAVFLGQTAEGDWSAVLQSTEDFTDPEENLAHMLSALESLKGGVRDHWNRCTLRAFDIAYCCGENSSPFCKGLPHSTLARITGVGAGVRVVAHTANSEDAPGIYPLPAAEAGRDHQRRGVPVRSRFRPVPPPAKRIVSKREYLARIGIREAKRWGSLGIAVVVGICASFGILCSLGALLGIGSPLGIAAAFAAAVSLFAAWKMKKYAEKTMEEAQRKLDVVPLTRANIGDLPASHTLVRASQEPPHSQQTELLRAADLGKETPPDELLRAVQENRQ